MKVSERKPKPICLICGERPAVSKGLCQRCYVFMRQRPDITSIEEGRKIWQKKKQEKERRPVCIVCKSRMAAKQNPDSPSGYPINAMCSRCYARWRKEEKPDLKKLSEEIREEIAFKQAKKEAASKAKCKICGKPQIWAKGLCESCYKNGAQKSKRRPIENVLGHEGATPLVKKEMNILNLK